MTSENNTLTIGKVAEKAEVRIDTVRYYERAGLIDGLHRWESFLKMKSPENDNTS